jgi:hypothetical protein
MSNEEGGIELNLDLGEENDIFIQSEKGKKIFKLTSKAVKFSTLMLNTFWNGYENGINNTITTQDNPFKISNASDENMTIIMNYLTQCGIDGKEEDPPEKPLPRDTIPNIFKGNDYIIFRDILESKEADKVKIVQISSLLIDITYFDIIKLREKASAAMASLFVGKPLEEIRRMVDYAETKL